MIVKLLTEHQLEFLSLKGGCRGSPESTHVKNVKLLEISCGGSFHLNSGKEEKDGRLYNWKEVTAEFLDASNDLELGELLHDSS